MSCLDLLMGMIGALVLAEITVSSLIAQSGSRT